LAWAAVRFHYGADIETAQNGRGGGAADLKQNMKKTR